MHPRPDSRVEAPSTYNPTELSDTQTAYAQAQAQAQVQAQEQAQAQAEDSSDSGDYIPIPDNPKGEPKPGTLPIYPSAPKPYDFTYNSFMNVSGAGGIADDPVIIENEQLKAKSLTGVIYENAEKVAHKLPDTQTFGAVEQAGGIGNDPSITNRDNPAFSLRNDMKGSVEMIAGGVGSVESMIPGNRVPSLWAYAYGDSEQIAFLENNPSYKAGAFIGESLQAGSLVDAGIKAGSKAGSGIVRISKVLSEPKSLGLDYSKTEIIKDIVIKGIDNSPFGNVKKGIFGSNDAKNLRYINDSDFGLDSRIGSITDDFRNIDRPLPKDSMPLDSGLKAKNDYPDYFSLTSDSKLDTLRNPQEWSKAELNQIASGKLTPEMKDAFKPKDLGYKSDYPQTWQLGDTYDPGYKHFSFEGSIKDYPEHKNYSSYWRDEPQSKEFSKAKVSSRQDLNLNKSNSLGLDYSKKAQIQDIKFSSIEDFPKANDLGKSYSPVSGYEGKQAGITPGYSPVAPRGVKSGEQFLDLGLDLDIRTSVKPRVSVLEEGIKERVMFDTKTMFEPLTAQRSNLKGKISFIPTFDLPSKTKTNFNERSKNNIDGGFITPVLVVPKFKSPPAYIPDVIIPVDNTTPITPVPEIEIPVVKEKPIEVVKQIPTPVFPTIPELITPPSEETPYSPKPPDFAFFKDAPNTSKPFIPRREKNKELAYYLRSKKGKLGLVINPFNESVLGNFTNPYAKTKRRKR